MSDFEYYRYTPAAQKIADLLRERQLGVSKAISDIDQLAMDAGLAEHIERTTRLDLIQMLARGMADEGSVTFATHRSEEFHNQVTHADVIVLTLAERAEIFQQLRALDVAQPLVAGFGDGEVGEQQKMRMQLSDTYDKRARKMIDETSASIHSSGRRSALRDLRRRAEKVLENDRDSWAAMTAVSFTLGMVNDMLEEEVDG